MTIVFPTQQRSALTRTTTARDLHKALFSEKKLQRTVFRTLLRRDSRQNQGRRRHASSVETRADANSAAEPQAGSIDDDEADATAEVQAGVSRLTMQEILLFCFQQDLDSALMRALNLDETERAQEIRKRLQTIDEAVQEIQAVKDSGGQTESPSLQQAFSRSVSLRASLQEAIVQERYEDASKLRDELKGVQDELDAADCRADLAKRRLAEQRRLQLGQRVKHRELGYRAVVCGWDASCCESEDWQDRAGVQALGEGPRQPFYQLLVDLRDCRGKEWRAVGPIAYVAQERLEAPQTSWVEEHGEDGFSNPFSGNLFLGQDERGDLLPSRALRDKFSQERRDVFPPGDDPPADDPPGDA